MSSSEVQPASVYSLVDNPGGRALVLPSLRPNTKQQGERENKERPCCTFPVLERIDSAGEGGAYCVFKASATAAFRTLACVITPLSLGSYAFLVLQFSCCFALDIFIPIWFLRFLRFAKHRVLVSTS